MSRPGRLHNSEKMCVKGPSHLSCGVIEIRIGVTTPLTEEISVNARNSQLSFEPVREKTNNLGSDQVRQKPNCTVIEDGSRLEILDKSRGIVLSV